MCVREGFGTRGPDACLEKTESERTNQHATGSAAARERVAARELHVNLKYARVSALVYQVCVDFLIGEEIAENFTRGNNFRSGFGRNSGILRPGRRACADERFAAIPRLARLGGAE